MKSGVIRQRARERHAKRALRWQRHLERQRDLNYKIKAAASDILQSPNFKSTRRHIQHGNVTVNNHCMNVARYSLAISEKLHIHSTLCPAITVGRHLPSSRHDL